MVILVVRMMMCQVTEGVKSAIGEPSFIFNILAAMSFS